MYLKVEPTYVVTGTTTAAGFTNTWWASRLIPFEEQEVIEETITIRRVIRRPVKMQSPYYPEACAFDNWDWERNPVAMMSCPCKKCSPRY